VVVDAESKKTNKTTLRSEWRGVQKKVCKKEKQALTQPALLEMYDYPTNQDLATQNVPTSLLTQNNFRFARHPPTIAQFDPIKSLVSTSAF
jgi:hypothetical protein